MLKFKDKQSHKNYHEHENQLNHIFLKKLEPINSFYFEAEKCDIYSLINLSIHINIFKVICVFR